MTLVDRTFSFIRWREDAAIKIVQKESENQGGGSQVLLRFLIPAEFGIQTLFVSPSIWANMSYLRLRYIAWFRRQSNLFGAYGGGTFYAKSEPLLAWVQFHFDSHRDIH